MSQDQLGLFDTPPNRQEIRFAIAVVGLLFVALLIVATSRNPRLAPIDSFIPAMDAILILSDLIVATLLYAQAAVFRSRALTVLASGYVFGALMLIPHLLTFPGTFAPDGLLGAGTSTTSWTFMFRRLGFPVAIILYVLLKRADLETQSDTPRRAARVAVGLLVAIALAAAFTLLATIGHDLLPQIYLNRNDVNLTTMVRVNVAYVALGIVATAMLLRQCKSLLDMWLLVALAGWLVHLGLILIVQGRFTVGYYYQALVVLVSSLVVMFALIAEFNRLYARLALSTAARNREGETRLMSMDAVAAAISHEAGQPLSAVILNANAGLSWLTRTRPDRQKAIQSLRATIDDGQRTFDVIKSIRAMFARVPGSVTEFSLNDLVRETAMLLDRELAAAKVSLTFELDEDLPSTFGSRVQIQRVLMNLLTNAIELISATRRKSRRITIRTMLFENDVLLEIVDTGVGIAPEQMPYIYDAFFTTKSTGTGLGLSLCRTIVEEHGGRLWTTSGDEHGATSHVRLPRSG